jgi:hypothetical protein
MYIISEEDGLYDIGIQWKKSGLVYVEICRPKFQALSSDSASRKILNKKVI